MSSGRVNGTVVVVCLTVMVLGALGALVWLSASGKDAPVALGALVALLGAAVPGVINTLGIAEVRHQTNGNTTRLMDLLESVSRASSAPPAEPPPAEPPRSARMTR